ncbi:MAG: WxL domain-containing protein [Lactobacillaceae bacterium]|jgi:hypothetical protein|nr:WxL domain-containing protein [Lactobacillaceae bacterium]
MNKTALLSTTLLATLSLSTLAFADTTPVDYNSKASIAFTPSTDPTNPVDPTNPDDPIKPVDPDGTDPEPGTAGPLSIDFASSLDFGAQSITSVDKTYYAAAQKAVAADGSTVDKPNYVQVTDNTGTDQGWGLTVTQQAQLADAKGNTLKGAAINFANGEAVTGTNTDAGTPTATASYSLVPGTASNVTSAAINQGEGTWVTRYGSDATSAANSITLSVPGVSTKRAAAYTSTLQWTLTQNPSTTVQD